MKRSNTIVFGVACGVAKFAVDLFFAHDTSLRAILEAVEGAAWASVAIIALISIPTAEHRIHEVRKEIEYIQERLKQFSDESQAALRGMRGMYSQLSAAAGDFDRRVDTELRNLDDSARMLIAAAEAFASDAALKPLSAVSKRAARAALSTSRTAVATITAAHARGTTYLQSAAWSAVCEMFVSDEFARLTTGEVWVGAAFYLDVLTSIIRDVTARGFTKGLRLRLDAVTNVLPEQWFNLRGVMNDTRLNTFFEDYTRLLSELLASHGDRIVVARYFLTYDDEAVDGELRQKLDALGVSPVAELTRQSRLNVRAFDGVIQAVSVAAIKRNAEDWLSHDEQSYYRSDVEKAYVITTRQSPQSTNLIDAFSSRAHSVPLATNARVVILGKDAEVQLDLLPRSADDQPYPDFVVLSLEDEMSGQTHGIIAICTRLRLPEEATAIRVIDDMEVLESGLRRLRDVFWRSSRPLSDFKTRPEEVLDDAKSVTV